MKREDRLLVGERKPQAAPVAFRQPLCNGGRQRCFRLFGHNYRRDAGRL